MQQRKVPKSGNMGRQSQEKNRRICSKFRKTIESVGEIIDYDKRIDGNELFAGIPL
jgi:hypothetical protein